MRDQSRLMSLLELKRLKMVGRGVFGYHDENESIRNVLLNVRGVEIGTWILRVSVRTGATEGYDPGVSPDTARRLVSAEGEVPSVKLEVNRTTGSLDGFLTATFLP